MVSAVGAFDEDPGFRRIALERSIPAASIHPSVLYTISIDINQDVRFGQGTPALN